MKRIATFLLALFASAFANAATCDLAIRQLDAWGNEVTRLVAVPAGCSGASGVMMYDLATAQPQIFVLDSTLAFGSGTLGVSSTLLANYVTSTSLTTTLASYATSAALTAGLATKFNAPVGTTLQYIRGDGSLATFPTIGTGTVTSVAAGAGLSGGTITTSGTISMPNVGTAGTYSRVTTDAQGRVTAGVNRTFSDYTPTLNSCFQLSSTQDARVSFAVDVTLTITLAGTPRGSAYLRYYTDSSCTANQRTIISGSSGFPTTLSVIVGQQNLGSVGLNGTIPAGTWGRVETVIDSGSGSTVTFATRQGQVTLE